MFAEADQELNQQNHLIAEANQELNQQDHLIAEADQELNQLNHLIDGVTNFLDSANDLWIDFFQSTTRLVVDIPNDTQIIFNFFIQYQHFMNVSIIPLL